ncbi:MULTISPECIES: protein phosphatase 2C domain-containing protein [unclassified Streptomyces]|uniref:protein phosphatase 2C domain-containing protein n=1 Tax=unclassified Streptomyces TaxID=2593676 RepID=UPI002E3538E1|nr:MULTISPECIES: protein phosphatase 2C domain-containing protein [unclassified Streptomyces]
MSMHRLSGCPGCAEPLEEADRFCGVCGHPVPAGPDAGPPGGAAPSGADGDASPAPGPSGAESPRAPAPWDPGAPDAYQTPAPAGPGGPDAAPGGGPGYPGDDRERSEYGSAGEYAARAVPSPPTGRGRPYDPEPAAPAGGYGSGVPAPGWGSVTSAAPTLVDDAGDWSAAPADPAPAAAWQSGPAQEHPYGNPQGTGPAQEPPYGTAHEPPYGTAQGSPHGDTASGPGEGGPWQSGPAQEPPYSTPQEPPQEAGAAPGDGKTCVACRAGRVDTDGYCEHCGHAQPRERDHLEEELGSVAAVSDRGLRHHRNEDSFAVAATALPDGSAATVAIVCDGVSSASRPDEASAAAAGAANEALLEALPRGAHPQEAMHDAILAAAAAVNALAPEVPGAQNAPACTLVGAVVSGGVLTIGWVGDSRAYWVPDDRAALPRRLTEDDSWAAQMVAAGLMGEAEAYADVRAHAITGWLGADAYDLEPHTASFKPDHPGVVVVCTDGLWNYAESAREMAEVLPPDAAFRPLHSAQVLVGHALDGGGHDNITVAVVPFAAAPPRPPVHAETEPETEPTS